MLFYGISKELSLSLLDILIRIMWDAKLREKALWAHVNYWKDHFSHGHPRSKIVLYFQLPKLNTLPPVIVVHKYFR
jgi:hypothetical protein